MEWVKAIAQYGVIIVAVIVLIGDRLKRKDTVEDKTAAKTDKLAALEVKVDKNKVETDKELLAIRKDMSDMDARFQEIFTNLDNKLDDSLRHVAKGNALLMAQSVNSIAYRALKILSSRQVDGDDYRNLNREFQSVRDLVGVPDDPDVLYLSGLMKQIEQLRMQ